MTSCGRSSAGEECSDVTQVKGSWIQRALHRITASDAELDAEQLQSDSDRAGAEAVSACCRGEQVHLAGRLTSVVYTPRETTPTLEAELFDGSGTVLLVWLGRRRIAGIEPGRCLVAKGRLAVRDNRLVIYNPWYELQAQPA
jgi:RecJ-like exonuclease